MEEMRACVVAALVLGACSGSPATPDAQPDAAVVPVFRNPVATPDAELAPQALAILGKIPAPNSAPCKTCHTMTRTMLGSWQVLSADALPTCFADLSIATTDSALAMIDCMRADPGIPASDYDADKLGIYSSGAELPWFEFLFWRAYGNDRVELDRFIAQAGMPRGSPTLVQADFDLVTEWFMRGLPNLEDHVPPDP